jgi:hypothetical protein
MDNLVICAILIVLLWIGWELHRIARLATMWADESERQAREYEQQKTSLVPLPEYRIPNLDMSGWKSVQKPPEPGN